MSWAIIYDISSSIISVRYLVVEDPRELVANDRNLYELIGAPAPYDHIRSYAPYRLVRYDHV